LNYNKTQQKAYQKANKKMKLKEAKNGIFYLPKGVYTVKIGDAESVFEVK
jgi:hypothetical protein